MTPPPVAPDADSVAPVHEDAARAEPVTIHRNRASATASAETESAVTLGSMVLAKHECECGILDEEVPVLDVRAIPHAIRHATVFGALDSLAPGGGLVLVAPHDPLPLLSQIEERTPGQFSVRYLESGPEAWQLVLTRDGAHEH
ncbi:DUF2249 domain-containing protein [Glaciibacter superstes]|uniref:DUF2249 domain-containing protein n=1 Tax=Glaciibacter superstes TaxID=501023 RepID=UPI0003B4FD70